METLVEHTTDLDSYGLSLMDSLCSAFEKVSIFRERQIPEKLQRLLASAGRGQSGRNVWRHGVSYSKVHHVTLSRSYTKTGHMEIK